MDAPTERAPHALTVAETIDAFETDPEKGLTREEAGARLARLGPNAVPEPPPPHPLLQLLRQLADPLVGALLLAAVVAGAVATSEGDTSLHWALRYSDTFAILLIVALNAALGFIQERKAAAALDALRSMASPTAKVLRGGQTSVVQASELTLGDVVVLEAGDAVPADLRLITTFDLATVEAALTGESTLVGKDARWTGAEDTMVAERKCMVFMGTAAARGRGRGVVVGIGAGTEIGKIGALIGESRPPPTPLEEHLAWFGKAILIVCLVISASLFAIGMLRGTGTWSVMLLTAVSLAVAAIPEGLPAITTITLGIGMLRMAERGAIIRKLPAVETLGSATVVCTDKTGTLTQNAMTVRVVETLSGSLTVTGTGYAPEGGFATPEGPVDTLPEAVEHLLRVGVICDTAELQHEDGRWSVVGDPTEGALLTLAKKGGLDRQTELESLEVEHEVPFDSERRMMAVVVRHDDGRRMSYVKGGSAEVLARCTRAHTEDGVVALDDEQKERLLERTRELASEAMRVLALAERPDPGEDPEQELVFLGLVGMIDPPRPGVVEAIEECHQAGIRVVMMTGDHVHTAEAIATELGFFGEGDLSVTGQQLGQLDDEALEAELDQIRVFARVSPDQKLRVVHALTKQRHVVAMTGDGVNDAPALRAAAIGVAMGKAGTDVARDAAEMVLADDDFTSIVAAVRQGRAIFANIQKFVFFLNSSNAGLVLAVVIGSFFAGMPQLTPLQLLWVNLITNGMPALALGVDPPQRDQMLEQPRPLGSGLMSLRDVWGIAVVGTMMGASAFGVMWLPHFEPTLFADADVITAQTEARTMAFSILAISPLFHAFNCRSFHASIFQLGLLTNRHLWLAVAISASIHLVTFVPVLRPVFHTHPMTVPQWGIVLLLSFLPVPVVETIKVGLRWRSRSGSESR